MTRTLVLIAGASFILATVCFAGAAALGWNGVTHHHWGDNWDIRVGDDHDSEVISHHTDDGAGGSTETRDIAWPGGDALDTDLDANVHFTQAPGPAKLEIVGPKNAVDHVVLSGSQLRFQGDGDYNGPITVTLTAPNVRHFTLAGSGDLAIDGYDQDELNVDVSGSGNVTAHGKAKSVRLDISGDGDADLGGVATDSAQAEISGSGKATVAPTNVADLHISGEGEIDLKTHPAKVTSDVSGDGKIVEGDQTTKSS